MIDDVLTLLLERLNSYFKFKTGTSQDVVAFVDNSQADNLSIPVNKVAPILVNVEEDKSLRQADRFEGKIANGLKTHINPTICINLLVLFVCRFADYKQSLRSLSLIIKFFQRNQLLDHSNTPELDPEIDRLKIELITLPVSQQNEIWSALRSAYIPSVSYKVGIIAFQDDESFEIVHTVTKPEGSIQGK
ncbi:MAG: DUF4255 domain-containing protein [Williamsia sp.]|nr:DUF4255 domain-containing protein [Williamsia sp.]